jgi:prolyl 4-hydroxylase
VSLPSTPLGPPEDTPDGTLDDLESLPADWRAWVIENVGRGCTPESMLPLLEGAGFGPETARRAVDQARAARRRPEPDVLDNLRLVDGREVAVRFTLQRPRVILFDGFLSDGECDDLAALAAERMAPSTVVDDEDGRSRPDLRRTSAGTWFDRGAHPLVDRIERRIEQLVHWPLDHGEGLQVLRYEAGGEYRAHHDYFDPAKPGSADHLAVAGQRVATVILYLGDVERGGGTHLPKVGLDVRPRKGSALYFADVDADGRIDPATLHAGLPVVHGVKLIATKWLRERTFGLLGQGR